MNNTKIHLNGDKPFKLLKGDWYFEGYKGELVPRKNGKGMKRVFVYIGTYYRFDMSDRRRRILKLLAAGCYLLTLAAYLGLSFGNFTSTAFSYVSIPMLLTVIPLLYLGIGIICLCASHPEMTLRERYASVRRSKRAVCASLAFFSLTLVGDLVFMVQYRGYYFLRHELFFPLLCIAGLATLSVIWYLLLKHPLVAVAKEKETPVSQAPDDPD